jgi:hypothetical protein
MKKCSISGRQYGDLKVLGMTTGNQLICRCSCGGDCLATRVELESGKKDCGHSTPIQKTPSRAYRISEAEGQRLGEQLLAEAEEEKMAPVRAIEAKTNDVLRKLKVEEESVLKTFWALPLAEIAKLGIGAAPVDNWLRLESSEAARDSKAEALAYRACKSDFEDAGITLSGDGWARVGSYLQVQAAKLGVNIATAESWSRAVQRLYELGVFQEGEISGDLAQFNPRSPVPESKPKTFDDVLRESGDSRADDERLRNVVVDAWTDEVGALAIEWGQSLQKNFGLTLTAEHKRWCLQYFRNAGLNVTDPRSLDRCRVEAVNRGIFPPTCLTCGEVLTQQLDGGQVTEQAFLYHAERLRQRGLWNAPRAAAEM